MGATLVGALLVAALLAWQLGRGPIDLDVAVPYLRTKLDRPGAALVIRFEHLAVARAGRGSGVELRLRDVRLAVPNGETVATIPTLALRLSLRALLRGRVAPVAIGVLGPRLKLLRHPDGDLDLGVGEARRGAGGAALGPVLAALRGTAPPESLLSALHQVRVEDGALEVVDDARGTHVGASVGRLTLQRAPDGVRGDLAGTVTLGGAAVPIRAGLLAAPAGRLAATVTFSGVMPPDVGALLAPGSTAADALARVRVPLAGTVRVALDRDLRLVRAHADLRGAGGTLVLPELPAGAIALDHGRLAARFDRAADLVAARVRLTTPAGVGLHGRGRLSGLSGPGTLRAEATVTDLETRDVPQYWPAGVAPGVRRWVTAKVSGGRVSEARVQLRAGVADADVRTLVLRALHGALTYRGLAVRYLDTMTPVRDVGGRAHFSPRTWSFSVTRGSLGALAVTGATAELTDLDVPGRARLAITGNVRGPLAGALQILDEPPLGRARALGLTPSQVGGAVTARVTLALPLGGRGPAARVAVTSSSELKDVTLTSPVRGWRFEGGALTIVQDASAVRVMGRGRLAGTEVVLEWTEQTAPGASTGRRVLVTGRPDNAGRSALGFDLRPWMEGPTDVRAQLTQDAKGRGRASVDVDLTPTLVAVPLLPRKAAGAPGRGQAQLVIENNAVRRIEDVEVRLNGSVVRGQATLGTDGRPSTVDAKATLAPRSEGSKPGDLTLVLRPAARGHAATLSSDDVGAVLGALDSSTAATGGRLQSVATVDLAALGVPFDGRVDVTDVILTRMPWLAQVATLTSFSGTASALTGSGVRLDRITAGLSQRSGVLTITDGVMSGPSLRVLVTGTVDLTSGSLALKGTLVPSYYGLNELPGRVPVIGGLLTGGQGMQAFDFTVTGPRDAPAVSAKLSSLTPGAFRDVARRLGL